MSFCIILNNLLSLSVLALGCEPLYGEPSREETRIRTRGLGGVMRSQVGNLVRLTIRSIFGESQRLICAQPPVSGIGLVPGRNILCKLANNSPPAHHTRDKLGCCIISYRNIISFFSRQFLGNFSANLKLPLNRGTPTLLLNLYLTYLNAIFVSFCYPEGDKKSVKMEGAK